MFQSFDLFSLCMSSILASTAFGVVFACLWRGRREDAYLLYWSASSLLYAIDLVAFEFGGRSSVGWGCCLYGILSVVNILAVCGMREIEGRGPVAPWMAGLVLITMAGYGLPFAARDIWPAIPVAAIAISKALALSLSMAVIGTACIRSGRRCGSRGGAITGLALFGYIPGYMLAIVGELGWHAGNHWLALIPMLSDQLLLGVLNLGLLAIPIERAQAELRDAALRDPLTGCWNRAGFAQRHPTVAVNQAAIVAFDIDHFKQINDHHGHAVGDEVLVRLAHMAMVIASRFAGEVIRLGGDEFVVLLPDRSERDAWLFANQLRIALQDQAANQSVTISIGIAEVRSEETDYSAALRRADASLYMAKRQGRNRIAA